MSGRRVTPPMPNPAMNVLERWLWFADRLEEGGVLYDPRSDVRELAALYRKAYGPLEQDRQARLLRLFRETKP